MTGGPEFERDQIARDLRASVVRRDALEARVRELSFEASRARREAEGLEHRVGELERELAQTQSAINGAEASREGERVRRLERERRELWRS